MSLLHWNYFSHALGKASACFVVVPDSVKPPYRVVYLLHGHSDDYTIWQRRTGIERYAEAAGLMVVMPDGGRGWYSDARDGVCRYESHILETVHRVDALLPTCAKRTGRGIGGLSMGGYGALKLALKHRKLFGSVVAHSGVHDIAAWHRTSERRQHLRDIFGPKVPPGDDCLALASAIVGSRIRPRMRIDCGVDDFLIEHNRTLHRHLARLGIANEYDEFPGSHTWEYWDAHIPQALAFHDHHLLPRRR